MTPVTSTILRRVLSDVVFEKLVSYWQELAKTNSNNTILLTDEIGIDDLINYPFQVKRDRFSLLLSPQGNALLRGQPLTSGYDVSIIVDNQLITEFLTEIECSDQINLKQPIISEQQSHFQDQLLLKVVDIILPESLKKEAFFHTEAINKNSNSIAIEAALYQQIAQERLLSQVIAQIRQSLEVSTILETAVTEVRRFLQVDRLVIYQFSEPHLTPFQSVNSRTIYGEVTYESRISNAIPSLLHLVTENDCFTQVPHYQEKYLNGQVVAIDQVGTAYSSSFCLVDLLQKYQIEAKLIAPILVKGKVWGLLIAHQCSHQRQWQKNEISFLGQIGEHLAVAIYQAQLYAEVQHQKNTFEKRVVERTQDLRDALLAAQAASHLKSEFLDNISHELRTPLTCVIGLSGTLLHWFEQERSLSLQKQQAYLKMIQDSGKKLMGLINDIIELSQLESGKAALNFQIFSVYNLAQTILERLQGEAQSKQIHLQLDFQMDLKHDQLCADPERIQQILLHLLGNGLKFTPERGSVILRIWEEKKQIIFQVEDTGVGIEQDQFIFLFEAFKQLDSTRQRSYEGSGLGLALTKQLVELHGGSIDVESIKGKGSIFTIFIPVQSVDKISELVPVSLEPETPTLFNSGVVVLERNEEVATLICELLTAADYQVIWLIDSSIAIKQIELLQPGIVLIDRDFEDVKIMSKILKRSQYLKSIKIVVLNDNLPLEEEQAYLASGVDAFLPKPLQPDALLQQLNTLINHDAEGLTETTN
ncbi:MAG: ATP-binding protein [Snowella sp.]|nr:ATP-binding protein [Snowella sp.]